MLGGVLYEKAGYAGVFGIGFAVLAIDFIMRLLVIEKKVAARYETKDPTRGDLDQDLRHERTHQNGASERNEDTEETPLLSKKEQDYYKISPDQPAIAQKIKLLPCLKHPGLVTAFLISSIQAFLLGSFDAVSLLDSQNPGRADGFSDNSHRSGAILLLLIPQIRSPVPPTQRVGFPSRALVRLGC